MGEEKMLNRFGFVLGFSSAYLIFTTSLFWIFRLADRIDESFPFYAMMFITLAITALAQATRKWLQ
jgi:hypothetical protein